MAVWDFEKIYFDGLGGDYTFDQAGIYWDSLLIAGIEITLECQTPLDTYTIRELNNDILIETEVEFDFEYSSPIDLIQLIPLKFHDSTLLQQYIYNVGLYVGSWLSKIKLMPELWNPSTIGEDYIQYLADLIGWKLYRSDITTLTDLRKQLEFVIELYKRKGTYKSLEYITYLNKLNLNIWDMYCDSEAHYNSGTFSRQEWFVGKYAGENPSGLSASYFKTPHFGMEILLNKVYDEGLSTGEYLWKENLFTPFATQIEWTRPVNTVFHYSIFLNPKTIQNGEVMIVDGNIKTKITEDWTSVLIYFDNDKYFDNGKYFDASDESFINSITKWKLGTGNKGVSPGDSSFSGLENVVLTGNIDKHTKYLDRNTFEFTISSATVQNSISELGLFLSDGTTAVCYSTFPDIDKHSGIELRILVEVYK